jgi:hypothetical protein
VHKSVDNFDSRGAILDACGKFVELISFSPSESHQCPDAWYTTTSLTSNRYVVAAARAASACDRYASPLEQGTLRLRRRRAAAHAKTAAEAL